MSKGFSGQVQQPKRNTSAVTVYRSITQTQFSMPQQKLFSAKSLTKQVGICMPDFKVVNKTLTFKTQGEISFVDLSDNVLEVVAHSGIKNGVVHIFAPHATGVIILTENDEGLLMDIKALLEELVPKHRSYNHPSNAHSHLRSMLLPPDKTLPVVNGCVEFGTWQSLFFVETDVYPRERTVIIQVMGEQ